MRLFHASGSCSTGILIILEELDLKYDLRPVSLAQGEQTSEAYKRINPKMKVPTLELDDGNILTEWPAIAMYLASSRPEYGLAPKDPLGLARTLEAIDYVVATVHMQGFTRIVRPGAFTPNAADHDGVIARGREIFGAGLRVLSTSLADKAYLMEGFSIADAALFYVEHWMVERLKGTLPPNLADHHRRMLGRDGVARALAKTA